jgi:hypothetical protein
MRQSFLLLCSLFSLTLFAQDPPTKVEREAKMDIYEDAYPSTSSARGQPAGTRDYAPTPSMREAKRQSKEVAGEMVSPIYKTSFLMRLDGTFLSREGNVLGVDNRLEQSTIVDESGREQGQLYYYYDDYGRLKRITRHYTNTGTRAPVSTFEYEYRGGFVQEYQVNSNEARYLIQEIPVNQFKQYWSY